MASYRLQIAGSVPQMEFWQSPHRFRLFVGGIGAGKTRAGAVEVLRQPSNSVGMIVAPTYKVLSQATILGLMEVVRPLLARKYPDDPVDLVESLNKADWELVLVNGTKVFLRSAEIPDNLRGPSLGWFWLDEGAFMAEDVWKVMLGRLRQKPERGWITTTPQGFNWVYRTFVKEVDADNYSVVRSTTFQNPYTSDTYKNSLSSGYDVNTSRQELEAEFIEWVDSPCYPDFKRAIHCHKGLLESYNPHLPIDLCCDFNYRYMCWPIVQFDRRSGVDRVISEVVMRKPATTAGMVQRFRNLFPAHNGILRIYGDASGKARSSKSNQSDYDIIAQELKGYSAQIEWKVPVVNPPIKDRINSLGRRLRGEDGQPYMEFDEDHAPETILDFLQTQWAKGGKVELQIDDPNDDRSERTHATSAIGYRAWREFPTMFGSTLLTQTARMSRRRGPLKYGRLLGEVT